VTSVNRDSLWGRPISGFRDRHWSFASESKTFLGILSWPFTDLEMKKVGIIFGQIIGLD
jgi:hypothetical protein